MAYQVLARKYRPKRFQDIVGQRGVTQTLRNAIDTKRLAQAFVFAGPRGVGKTTTARLLARALNCDTGPTPDPCGNCDACVEIAEGRDIDVLEIDAATHTQVENVREVIIAGLAMAPVRNRYKIFIIDEFHQLSNHSFNALLKSLEEPPPHVVFMMATTELQKIPETILSRSQVFEFRTINTQTISDKLRAIASAEKISVDDTAISLLARAAEGSMRDAQSAFDQVIAFSGNEVTAEKVSSVLGLISRNLVLKVIEIVADENPSEVFKSVDQFVESGYDLKLVCREITRAVRDLLVISIDSKRANDPEIAGDAERDQLIALAQRFSCEDLMRAFDVLERAEFEIRNAAQPRYHLEIALLKWIHLRNLIPLTKLLESMQLGDNAAPSISEKRSSNHNQKSTITPKPQRPSKVQARESTPKRVDSPMPSSADQSSDKNKILVEIKRAKKFFYGTVVAQAQRIILEDNRLIFSFSSSQQTLETQLENSRAWLETLASKIVNRTITVTTEKADDTIASPKKELELSMSDETQKLKTQAMNDKVVQAMLEVFPAEIGDVEELD